MSEQPAKRRTLRDEFFNLPNMLTMARIAVIPLVLFFVYYESRINSFIAACLFSAASVTDFFDGWLARRMGLITGLGKFLDPLADKLILISLFFSIFSAWQYIGRFGRAVTGKAAQHKRP